MLLSRVFQARAFLNAPLRGALRVCVHFIPRTSGFRVGWGGVGWGGATLESEMGWMGHDDWGVVCSFEKGQLGDGIWWEYNENINETSTMI